MGCVVTDDGEKKVGRNLKVHGNSKREFPLKFLKVYFKNKFTPTKAIMPLKLKIILAVKVHKNSLMMRKDNKRTGIRMTEDAD